MINKFRYRKPEKKNEVLVESGKDSVNESVNNVNEKLKKDTVFMNLKNVSFLPRVFVVIF